MTPKTMPDLVGRMKNAPPGDGLRINRSQTGRKQPDDEPRSTHALSLRIREWVLRPGWQPYPPGHRTAPAATCARPGSETRPAHPRAVRNPVHPGMPRLGTRTRPCPCLGRKAVHEPSSRSGPIKQRPHVAQQSIGGSHRINLLLHRENLGRFHDRCRQTARMEPVRPSKASSES